MKPSAAWLVLGILLAAVMPARPTVSGAEPPKPRDFALQLQYQVPVLTQQGKMVSKTAGTAFFAKRGGLHFIVTAYHVVQGHNHLIVSVRMPEGREEYRALRRLVEDFVIDTSSDTCIFRCHAGGAAQLLGERFRRAPIELRDNSDLELKLNGKKLDVVGNPTAPMNYVLNEPFVNPLWNEEGDAKLYRSGAADEVFEDKEAPGPPAKTRILLLRSADITYGYSGGPVLYSASSFEKDDAVLLGMVAGGHPGHSQDRKGTWWAASSKTLIGSLDKSNRLTYPPTDWPAQLFAVDMVEPSPPQQPWIGLAALFKAKQVDDRAALERLVDTIVGQSVVLSQAANTIRPASDEWIREFERLTQYAKLASEAQGKANGLREFVLRVNSSSAFTKEDTLAIRWQFDARMADKIAGWRTSQGKNTRSIKVSRDELDRIESQRSAAVLTVRDHSSTLKNQLESVTRIQPSSLPWDRVPDPIKQDPNFLTLRRRLQDLASRWDQELILAKHIISDEISLCDRIEVNSPNDGQVHESEIVALRTGVVLGAGENEETWYEIAKGFDPALAAQSRYGSEKAPGYGKLVNDEVIIPAQKAAAEAVRREDLELRQLAKAHNAITQACDGLLEAKQRIENSLDALTEVEHQMADLIVSLGSLIGGNRDAE
jgi:hypothetical protein